MCAPAVAVGAISAVSGIVGGVAQHRQQTKAAKDANRANDAASKQQYEAQQEMIAYQNELAMENYIQDVRIQQESEKQYKQQIKLNTAAASRASVSAQNTLNADYRRAALEAAEGLATSMRTQGTVRATGRTGRSVGAILRDADREYGRNLGVLGLNLGYSNMSYSDSVLSIFEQQVSANNAAHSQRKAKPIKPKPLPGAKKAPKSNIKGPGAGSLIGTIGNAAISGYQTYQGLKAPSAK